jgi:hypothetical protein
LNGVLKVLPFISGAVSLVFAFLVFRRYLLRHGLHLLLWGIGLVFYAVGGLCEALHGALGWNPLVFRLWYLFGAMLVAAWLGQGTVYLWVGRRWAHLLMALLGIGSVYAAIRVFGAQLDPAFLAGSLHTGSELSGRAIVTPGVRSLTPIFNSYGTLALVGGARHGPPFSSGASAYCRTRSSVTSSSPLALFSLLSAEHSVVSGSGERFT